MLEGRSERQCIRKVLPRDRINSPVRLRFYQKERQEFDRAAENRRGCGVAQDWLAQPETGIEKIFNGEYVATSHQAKSQERNWLGQVCGAGLRTGDELAAES
jgi:hypothetical protein